MPVDQLIATKARTISGQVLFRCELDESMRAEVLKWLDAANMNFLSLFQDVIGAARFCNTKAGSRGGTG